MKALDLRKKKKEDLDKELIELRKAASGLKAEVESMPSWNFPSRSTNIV